MKNNIQVIIIDDHPIVLQGFANILRNENDIELVSTFVDAKEGIGFLATNHIDVVLLDINMPEINGIDACEMITKKNPGCKVIAISNNNENSIIQRMLQSGACGYILKNASAGELIQCIHYAAVGLPAISQEVKEILKSNKDGDVPKVTRRENEILHLLAKGMTSPEIAEKIFVSPLTIETHRRNLIQKFGVSNTASLIHKATELKFI